MVNLFLCRHSRTAFWQFSLRQNPLLWLGLLSEGGLLLLILYTPLGNQLFATQAFAPQAWVLMIFLGLGLGLLEELRKAFMRQRAMKKANGKNQEGY